MGRLRILGRYLRPSRRDFVLCALAIFVETAFELYIPIIMGRVIDEALPARDMGIALGYAAQMLGCAAVALVLGFVYARLSARCAMSVGAELRQAEYEHVQELAFSDLDEIELSSLVTRLTGDVTIIQNAIAQGLRPFLRSPANLVLALGFAISTSAELSVVYLVMAPVLGVALFAIVWRVSPYFQSLQRVVDQLNEVLQESLAGIRAVKAFVREDYVAARFEVESTDLATASTLTFRTAQLNLPTFTLCIDAVNVALLLMGGSMVAAGTITVGVLTTFMSYVLIVMNSFMMFSNVFIQLARALTSMLRVADTLSAEPAIASPADGAPRVEDGSVEFRDVSFKYSELAEEDVLEHVSLRVPAGSTLGVLGGTGSGKSSLVQLIPRLYDATEGQVLVGGRDVRSYDLAGLRAGVGIVLQQNVLFTGTVRENLLWGDPDAGDEELLEACRLACADEFLARIGGLDANLGHGGSNVSGGQRQRLCIARTLLKRPRVLVFDDSTSAVDMATDARIRANLAGLGGMTKIVIAQRVSSVMDADQIVVLDDGRVHGVGTHEELLERDDIYRELCELQLAGGEEG